MTSIVSSNDALSKRLYDTLSTGSPEEVSAVLDRIEREKPNPEDRFEILNGREVVSQSFITKIANNGDLISSSFFPSDSELNPRKLLERILHGNEELPSKPLEQLFHQSLAGTAPVNISEQLLLKIFSGEPVLAREMLEDIIDNNATPGREIKPVKGFILCDGLYNGVERCMKTALDIHSARSRDAVYPGDISESERLAAKNELDKISAKIEKLGGIHGIHVTGYEYERPLPPVAATRGLTIDTITGIDDSNTLTATASSVSISTASSSSSALSPTAASDSVGKAVYVQAKSAMYLRKLDETSPATGTATHGAGAGHAKAETEHKETATAPTRGAWATLFCRGNTAHPPSSISHV